MSIVKHLHNAHLSACFSENKHGYKCGGKSATSAEDVKLPNVCPLPVLCLTCVQLATGRQFHSYEDFFVTEKPSSILPQLCTNEASDESTTPAERKVRSSTDDSHPRCDDPFTSCDVETQHADGKAVNNASSSDGLPLKLKLSYGQLLSISVSAPLAGCIVNTVKESEKFLEGFIRYSCQHGQRVRDWDVSVKSDHRTALCCRTQHSMIAVIVNIVYDASARAELDYRWNGYICHLVTKRLMLEDAMSWLSTLGGAYSALGDYDEHFAVKAGSVSLRQFRVALEMGDPPTVIRCRLFWALSLMQRGYLSTAKHIIRWQFQIVKELPVDDERLTAMCHGIWNRLRYLRIQSGLKKNS